MAQGAYTPLQITAAAGLLNNQGVLPLPAALVTALNSFNGTTLMTNFFAAVSFYKAQSFATESTLESLLSIGNTVCPALGNSVPAFPIGTYPSLGAAYYVDYLTPSIDGSTVDPSGLSIFIEQLGNAYLGDGDIGKFTQGFMAVQGYVYSTNQLVNSTVNAQTYLGPTFTSMSDLVTNSLSAVNTNLPSFAVDLANQGKLTNLQNLDMYGTPAALMQQIASAVGLAGTTVPALTDKLRNLGVTNKQISDLVTNNKYSLFNQDGLSINQFDTLQKTAYQAMTQVTGQDLQDILFILEITTPNIETLAELLDPTKIFPNSYQTMQAPTPNGWQPIYDPQGQVSMNLQNVVASYLASPSGCDELAKVIPPDQAVANKSIQVALQQVSNINNTTLPALANSIVGVIRMPWDIDNFYLADTVVAAAPAVNNLAQISPDTIFYRAQQDVDPGVDITDAAYWEPVTLGGISTMSGLPLIEAQTSAVDTSVANYINANLATGTGPNGNITTCDVIGLAYDHNDFATQLNTATTATTALQGAGSLSNLNNAYIAILSAVTNLDVTTQITNANNAIAALSASPYVTTLNTAWTYISNYLNLELGYQAKAAVNYFELLAGEKTSIYAFTQNLSQYGQQCESCGPNEFLQQIADVSVLSGQALIGSLREGENQMQLAKSQLSNPKSTLPPSTPPITPACAVVPIT